MKIRISILLALFFFAFGGWNSCVAQTEQTDKNYRTGVRFLETGQYEQAVIYLSEVITVDEDYDEAYLKRAMGLSMLEKYEEAIKDYTHILALNPEHTWAIVSRGSAYNKLGKFKLAMKDFNHALKLDPKDQEAYNNRGFAKKGLGDHKGACKDWKRSKRLGNEEAKVILKNSKCK